VVAPSGWSCPFPVQHHRLFQRIVARGGGHLSLWEPQQPAQRWTFLKRNRCMVAMADAAVVVEAPLRSGARNAASSARKLGTKLFVVPSAPWLPKGRGCLAELRAGATPLESHRDVLEYLEATGHLAREGQLALLPGALLGPGPAAPAPVVGGEDPTLPDSSGARVLLALRQGARHVADVCERTGLSVQCVQAEIFALRLQGLVRVDPSGTLTLSAP
jgi:DNA processing protein